MKINLKNYLKDYKKVEIRNEEHFLSILNRIPAQEKKIQKVKSPYFQKSLYYFSSFSLVLIFIFVLNFNFKNGDQLPENNLTLNTPEIVNLDEANLLSNTDMRMAKSMDAQPMMATYAMQELQTETVEEKSCDSFKCYFKRLVETIKDFLKF